MDEKACLVRMHNPMSKQGGASTVEPSGPGVLFFGDSLIVCIISSSPQALLLVEAFFFRVSDNNTPILEARLLSEIESDSLYLTSC